MNKGVNIFCKAFMTEMFTVVGILIDFSTSIENPNDYLGAFNYIG